jgi:hypothetical protein
MVGADVALRPGRPDRGLAPDEAVPSAGHRTGTLPNVVSRNGHVRSWHTGSIRRRQK